MLLSRLFSTLPKKSIFDRTSDYLQTPTQGGLETVVQGSVMASYKAFKDKCAASNIRQLERKFFFYKKPKHIRQELKKKRKLEENKAGFMNRLHIATELMERQALEKKIY